jgi:hypothetical protein
MTGDTISLASRERVPINTVEQQEIPRKVHVVSEFIGAHAKDTTSP